MAEIKSTLDLVMERTRHLTLSAEEKREQALSEFKKNLSGLLLRFEEGVLSGEQLQKELLGLQEQSGLTDRRIFIAEVLHRLGLDRDNAPLLTLLGHMYGFDTGGITGVLQDYRDTVAASAQNRLAHLKADLAARQGISGSAVVANLEADDTWATEKESLRQQFQARFAQQLNQLMQAVSS